MKNVFISRTLASDSPLQDLKKSYSIIDTSLIDFKEIPIRLPIACNWIFFYSKNGVKYFASAIKNKGFELDKYKFGCMGKGTGEAFKSTFQIDSHFVGNGDPIEVSDQFLKLLNPSDQVIFLSATQSNHSVEKILEDKVHARSMPVYSNEIKKTIIIPPCQIGIFTSPFNAEAFASVAKLQMLEVAIAIGKTTASRMHKLGLSEVIIATSPSDQGLYEAFQFATIH